MHSVFLHWLPFVVFGVHFEIIWEGGGQIIWELRYVPYKSFRGRGQIISDLEIISGYESIIIITLNIILHTNLLIVTHWCPSEWKFPPKPCYEPIINND